MLKILKNKNLKLYFAYYFMGNDHLFNFNKIYKRKGEINYLNEMME